MTRSFGAVISVAVLALGLFAAFSGSRSAGEIGAPPDALIQFDEETTAEFNREATTRQNRDRVIVVLAITLGLTGLIVVSVGASGESSD